MGERRKTYIPEETERKPTERHKEERKKGRLQLGLGDNALFINEDGCISVVVRHTEEQTLYTQNRAH